MSKANISEDLYARIAQNKFYQRYPSLFAIGGWFFISILIAVCVGSASAVFLLALDWATNFREANIWIISLLPIAGLVIGGFFYYWGKEIDPGNNLIIENIQNPNKTIPFKMAPFILIGTVLTHLFGGSAGREGTAIQMGGSIADQFTRIFRLSPSNRKIVLIAGMSAGFGSIFGTPLAGAVFGMEVYSIGKIRYNAIFPAFVASIIADFITHSWGVGHTKYTIDLIPHIDIPNIIYAILAGVAFGLAALLFSKSTHAINRLGKLKIKYPPLRLFIGGIIVAAVVFISGSTRYIGLGVPTIVESFTVQQAPWDFAIKIALTAITLGFGFKGGEVTPLFFIGATLGSALSFVIPLPVGLLAGMGFVAVFAGASNTPLACSIMAIELFGAECGVYVAVACVVAYLISGHNGIYSSQVIGQPKNKMVAKEEGKRLGELSKRK